MSGKYLPKVLPKELMPKVASFLNHWQLKQPSA